VLPARTEVILVADLDLAAEGVTDPDVFFLPGLFQAEGRVAVVMAANPERVQVIAIPLPGRSCWRGQLWAGSM